jgi:malonyl-CoA O-methyltransferase
VDKRLIKNSFSKAATHYDSNSELQLTVAKELLSTLSGEELGDVLDIGTGTGYLLDLLAKANKTSSLTALDLSSEMLSIAQTKLSKNPSPPPSLVAGDFEALPFPDASFDTIVSSLAFQWAQDLSTTLEESNRVLRDDGKLYFTTLGASTLRELRSCMDKIKDNHLLPPAVNFTQSKDVLSKMSELGFRDIKVSSTLMTRQYRDLFALLKTLKNIGAKNNNIINIKDTGLASGTVLRNLSQIYSRDFKTECTQGIIATYEVIFCSASKGTK